MLPATGLDLPACQMTILQRRNRIFLNLTVPTIQINGNLEIIIFLVGLVDIRMYIDG